MCHESFHHDVLLVTLREDLKVKCHLAILYLVIIMKH